MTAPYTALAAGYDVVMAHVDYENWAAYVHTLFRRHGDRVETVLELGGGTGSLALALQPLGPYDYTLTDASEAMLAQARAKIEAAGRPIRCTPADFTDFTQASVGASAPFDAAVLVYDGLNYLLDEADVARLFRCAHAVLRPGGLFIFDQSTPANSEDNAAFFVDEGGHADFAYVRESRYNPKTRRHVTTFDLTVDGEHARERHVQRAYAVDEVRELLDVSPFQVVAAYDGHTTERASSTSYRVHWVVRRREA